MAAARDTDGVNRANRILAIALGAIIVFAIGAAVVAAGRPATRLDPGTPEATVQAYVDAALAGRSDEAARWLDPAGECGAQDLDQAGAFGTDLGARVVLVDSIVNGDSATVQVEVVLGSGGPFDSAEFREQHTYRLTRSGGTWLLTGVPWPLYDCWKE